MKSLLNKCVICDGNYRRTAIFVKVLCEVGFLAEDMFRHPPKAFVIPRESTFASSRESVEVYYVVCSPSSYCLGAKRAGESLPAPSSTYHCVYARTS